MRRRYLEISGFLVVRIPPKVASCGDIDAVAILLGTGVLFVIEAKSHQIDVRAWKKLKEITNSTEEMEQLRAKHRWVCIPNNKETVCKLLHVNADQVMKIIGLVVCEHPVAFLEDQQFPVAQFASLIDFLKASINMI